MFFLDLKLPDMGGDEVFRETKAIDPELPIVIVTGYPYSDMLDRILQDGPVMVQKKPIDLNQLSLTMRIHDYKQPQCPAKKNSYPLLPTVCCGLASP